MYLLCIPIVTSYRYSCYTIYVPGSQNNIAFKLSVTEHNIAFYLPLVIDIPGTIRLYGDLQDHWIKTPEQTMINKPMESRLICLNEF